MSHQSKMTCEAHTHKNCPLDRTIERQDPSSNPSEVKQRWQYIDSKQTDSLTSMLRTLGLRTDTALSRVESGIGSVEPTALVEI